MPLRTLHQWCTYEGRRFPVSGDIIRRNLYVDGFLTRADDLNLARHRRDEIIQLTGGFELKKWVPNTSSLLNDICKDKLQADNSDNRVNFGSSWLACTVGFRLQDHSARLGRGTSYLAEPSMEVVCI